MRGPGPGCGDDRRAPCAGAPRRLSRRRKRHPDRARGVPATALAVRGASSGARRDRPQRPPARRGRRVAVVLGVSGAGLAAPFEPLRPYFVATTVLALGFGFVVLQREEKNACKPGTLCGSPIARRRMKWALWTATIVSIPLVSFPWWSEFVLG